MLVQLSTHLPRALSDTAWKSRRRQGCGARRLGAFGTAFGNKVWGRLEGSHLQATELAVKLFAALGFEGRVGRRPLQEAEQSQPRIPHDAWQQDSITEWRGSEPGAERPWNGQDCGKRQPLKIWIPHAGLT